MGCRVMLGASCLLQPVVSLDTVQPLGVVTVDVRWACCRCGLGG